MPKPRIWSLRAAGIAAALTIAAVVAAWPKPMPSRAPGLVSTLGSPALSDNGVIEARFSSEVAVAWDVRNVGQVEITALRAAVNCQCKIQEKFPETLQPGETARFSVRLRAPPAGTALREVRIFDDKHHEPLLTLAVRIRAQVSAPSWLTPPAMATLQGVAGRPFEHVLGWEAVENASDEPWVESLDGEPAGFVTLKLETESRPWGEDGRFKLRKYRVTVADLEAPADRKTGWIHIKYRAEPAEPQRAPVVLEFIQPLSVLPAKVEVGPSGFSARVVVVRRDSVDEAPAPRFDAGLLHVESMRTSEAGPMVYEIRPVVDLDEPATTEVLFEADGLEPARLFVRIAPAAAAVVP